MLGMAALASISGSLSLPTEEARDPFGQISLIRTARLISYRPARDLFSQMFSPILLSLTTRAAASRGFMSTGSDPLKATSAVFLLTLGQPFTSVIEFLMWRHPIAGAVF